MFTKILIANRGEIACRVIKTARKMGILTVAVYSDADSDALHVNMADEAIYLGPSPSRESYLVAEKVIEAAKRTGAQAIHPGYGFLSENADFCRMCEQENIKFIGPPVAAIEAMGSKSAAKNIMEKAQVPLVPGYHGEDQSEAVIKKAADDMGYPVLLKATAGGGGKGMRQVWSEAEFSEGFAAAKREAQSSFGDDTMLVEKYLTQPRHVEIQVFCDNHNNAVYLFERDCSVQRRHQKVIEEAPAFGMSESLRQKMGESAIKSAQAIGYQGAGTVEFLLDVDGSFYFMEMNTRLQVEHPVTELITGQDLVEWQLRVAAGEVLPKTQQELVIKGHAFEARIYAEDANNDFLPATGKLNFLQPPVESAHVRVDTGVRQGDEVSVFYDPMIAKLIVWDENREKALQRLSKALSEYRISGVTTNIDFLYNLATCPAFIHEDIDTGFIEKHQNDIFHEDEQTLADELPIAALYLVLSLADKAKANAADTLDPYSPWNNTNAWRLNEAHIHQLTLAHNDTDYPVTVEQKRQGSDSYYLITVSNKTLDCQGRISADTLYVSIDGYRSHATIARNGNEISLYRQNGVFNFTYIEPECGNEDISNDLGGLLAPMNGTMVSVLVKEGDTVKKDQPLMIMEAMKMEHTIKAPEDGMIDALYYATGDMVDGGCELLAFNAQEIS
ncbi:MULTISPECIES: acetyl/propionyl/methylcrotonyl-CoA carboxylase subunit alpha [Thalassotalea]|uniref:Acetyl/propionyl/methylcrotonyl-CoA carboxylase subunit alpha n=1 Tax=Thalassotalea castellviae TaxID=3075612 RepID=A0ABU3A333_9GAMM|nr:acetyl/propionyl/methylcrotonyl-CoA carboxylase subunit alpha [Thalassotalea sp. W431]MDT0604582.1 acetyl/propionyl/methylcrotonyl-CoA carboxylase subunit alpha [Thalassotalea sp. W431]